MILRSLILLALLLTGCATQSTIEKRRAERASAYQSLTREERAAVDQGQLKVDLLPDAVYIALGKPDSVSENDAGADHFMTWKYWGHYTQASHYMSYGPPTSSAIGGIVSPLGIKSEYNLRDYTRVEVVFKNGKTLTWQFNPQPSQ